MIAHAAQSTLQTFVLTLGLDPASQSFFDDMRRRHFPPERNLISAHVTLFHTLPPEPWIGERLRAAAGETDTFEVQVTGLRSLGRGVAYTLASPRAQQLHAQLSESFHAELTPQDRQRFQPHVVIQNKVAPAAARELLTQLQASFKPWTVRAERLEVWRYLGGPWEHAEDLPFAGES